MITDLMFVKDKIQQAGLKVTHQRMVILDAVLNMDFHPATEQIYEHLHPGNPSISLGTIYKTMETFVECGLLSRVFTDEACKRYDPNLKNHGHIYCVNTHEIIDYYDEELNDLITKFFRKRRVGNLKIKNITLQINGERIDPEKDITIK
jgi:Fur family transcriptional regulator, peroxide stress response regulator